MMKTAVQLDFDGTVTEEDVSFLLLDTFVGGGWRKYLDEYTSGDITVGTFNKKVFGMMIADRKTMTEFVLNSPRVKIRPGFKEFIDYCKNRGIEVVIVSNGLTFYIEATLEKLGIDGIDIHAAENVFSPGTLRVRYLGPNGKELETGFKEAYTDMLCKMGYQVIYVGNGTSDIYPSRKAQYVCATADLLELCREEKLKCYPYNDFFDVIKILQGLTLDTSK
jgi:2-hydroxy-3-keto-5-methylthiopentenyl-1-phosphate phosphatase